MFQHPNELENCPFSPKLGGRFLEVESFHNELYNGALCSKTKLYKCWPRDKEVLYTYIIKCKTNANKTGKNRLLLPSHAVSHFLHVAQRSPFLGNQVIIPRSFLRSIRLHLKSICNAQGLFFSDSEQVLIF